MNISKNTQGLFDAFEKIEECIVSHQTQLDGVLSRITDLEDKHTKWIGELYQKLSDIQRRLEELEKDQEYQSHSTQSMHSIPHSNTIETDTQISCWQWVVEWIHHKKPQGLMHVR